jgi:hypothetical protein
MIKTKSSAPFYIPLNITIRAFPDYLHNIKPYFLAPDTYTLHFTLDHFRPNYKLKLNVTEQLDDHNRLAWLNFSNNELGVLKIKYDLDAQIPKQEFQERDFMTYDPDDFTV